MVVTDHAKMRLKERCGIPKRAMDKTIDRALEFGVQHKECTGRLKRYVDYLYLSHCNGSNIRLYGGHAYIFSKKSLITVIALPGTYQKAVNKIIKRRPTDELARVECREE